MLGAKYHVTNSIIRAVVISTAIRVRQGSPTSCLFIYINYLIKIIKEDCESDGFLLWLDLLILMDDTLVSTSWITMIMSVL